MQGHGINVGTRRRRVPTHYDGNIFSNTSGQYFCIQIQAGTAEALLRIQVESAQAKEFIGDDADLFIVERACHFLAITGNKWNGVAFVQ